VLVTHNVFQVRRLADRVAFLLRGSWLDGDVGSFATAGDARAQRLSRPNGLLGFRRRTGAYLSK